MCLLLVCLTLDFPADPVIARLFLHSCTLVLTICHCNKCLFFGGGAYFSVAGKPCMPVSNGQSTNVVLQLASLHLNYNSAKVN